MPDQKKIDPFKPQQPSIPGVLPSEAKAKPEAPPPPEYPGAPQQKAPANDQIDCDRGRGGVHHSGGTRLLEPEFVAKAGRDISQ